MHFLKPCCTILAIALCGGGATEAKAQGRHARREARIAESAKPATVPGGVTIESALPYDKAYDIALTYLKARGYTLDSTDRDVGQVTTAMQVTGGYSQTGTRVLTTLIKDGGKTVLRVAMTQQKRKKALQAEPWGEPKIDDAGSSRIASDLKAALVEGGK